MHPRCGRVIAPLIHASRARTLRFSGSQVPREAPCLPWRQITGATGACAELSISEGIAPALGLDHDD
jgi:hypothetical protein